MSKRVMGLLCVVMLTASACGSRTKDSSANNSLGGSTTTSTAPADASAKIGTLDNPCGPGTPKAAPAGTPGITATTIKLAVISDKVGQVKIPTASIEESMRAFAGWCNGFGGIAGRKIVLDLIDSKLFQHLEATKQACNDNVFAIVGSGSVTDNAGAQAMVDCNLIEVPAYTATAQKAMSDNLVQPVPNPSNSFAGGPARYLSKKYPDAIGHAAMLASNIYTATAAADKQIEAYKSLGFTYVYNKHTGVVQDSYAAEAREMKQKGVKYFNMVASVQETAKVLSDMKTQGTDPTVVDLGAQYYDPTLLTNPAAEGAYVSMNTIPFEEASLNPALQAYLDAYKKVPTDIKPTSLGVQAFSAGLLFATAAKSASDDLTRANVLAKLKAIHSWDGGGMHQPTDPGANKGSDCTLLMQIQHGKFVRVYPTTPNTFACDPANRVTVHGDYGTGAKKKSS